MIPTTRLILSWLILGIASISIYFFGQLTIVFQGIAYVFIASLFIDLVLNLTRPLPKVSRSEPSSMALLVTSEITIVINNESKYSHKLEIFEHLDPNLHNDSFPLSAIIAPESLSKLTYEVTPLERGSLDIAGCSIRRKSPFGFFWRQKMLHNNDKVAIYPNYSSITKQLAYQTNSPIHMNGLRLQQRRGEGIEFHQLREFRDGDSIKSIDWKATARMQKLITREYQDERDQQVIFLVDTGRNMLAKDGALSHFDHTLNAMLLLSYIALKQGDSVGIMTAGRETTWLPPAKGSHSINSALNHVFDIHPEKHETDYLSAAKELSVKLQRRALIIILTNARDENTDNLLDAANLLRKRHLVLLASLKEQAVSKLQTQPISTLDKSLRWVATLDYLHKRSQAHVHLQGRGILTEDCHCSELPTILTNRYLAIKRAGRL